MFYVSFCPDFYPFLGQWDSDHSVLFCPISVIKFDTYYCPGRPQVLFSPQLGGLGHHTGPYGFFP